MEIWWWGAVLIFGLYQINRWIRWKARAVIQTNSSLDDIPSPYPLVSFLVAAWNAEAEILQFIEHYRLLSYPNRELVLCIGGQDRTWEMVSQLSSNDMQILQQFPGEGKQGALQKCMQYARGTIIYLTDIDCSLKDDTVQNLLMPLLTEETHVVTGNSAPRPKQLSIPLVLARGAIDLAAAPTKKHETLGVLGRNVAMTREALDRIGGFRVPAPSGTDYTLAQELRRAGYQIIYVPGFPMITNYAETWTSYIRQQRRWLRNIYVLGRKYDVRSDVHSASISLMLPYGLLILFILGVSSSDLALLIFVLMICHSIITRMGYQKVAGFGFTLWGAFQSFVGDEIAAMIAGIDIVLGRTIW